MNVYASKHQGSQAIERYWRKLSNRIDVLRHDIECAVLARYASGKLFDCTIGVGRFIGRLPAVTSQSGMDISAEFVAYVRAEYAGVPATVGDLTVGIDERTNNFDTVVCLRSLSAIGHVQPILAEMVRIARPGGVVIFDYGRTAVTQILNGIPVVTDGDDLEAAICAVDADVVSRIRCDAILTRLKRRRRVFRFFTQGAGSAVPDGILLALERLAAPCLWERQIIVLRKRSFASG